MNHEQAAADILQGVGGEENVQSVVHCATRLRFQLNDHAKADKKRISNIPGVIQVVESGGQYQVVIGNEVSDVFRELEQKTSKAASSGESGGGGGSNQNLFNRLIDIIAAIFTPVLGALVGAGILRGLVVLAESMNWLQEGTGTHTILDAMSDSVFFFLPILLAITTARKFGGDPYVAVIIAASLLYPTMEEAAASGETLSFFGIPVVMTSFASAVIPIVLAIFLMSKLEIWLRKRVHSSIRLFFVPLVLISLMVPVTLIVFGPFGTYVSAGLAAGYEWIYDGSAIIAGVFAGALWQVLVIFGLHWGFVPIFVNNLAAFGEDTMAALIAPAVFGQAGAVLGVLLKTKRKEIKTVAAPSTISGLFGVTEPAIYGVTLRYKKPFAMGVIGGGIGGGIAGLSGASSVAFALPGLPALPVYAGDGFVLFLIALAVAFFLAALLTYLFGFHDGMETEMESEEDQETENVASTNSSVQLGSPMTGALIPLSEVNDEAFASGAVGRGTAVVPTDGRLYAPASGIVSSVFPSRHAVGVTTDDGAEVLMHIGLNTVQLDGSGFELHVSQGQRVNKGDLLVTADLDYVSGEGFDVVTPVVVTNADAYFDVLAEEDANVQHGETILSIIKGGTHHE
ncbi:beta-glucoside-specific PTS transporter subunit IIABC [Alkalicoccus chagannorensis]|uniref:beta-glucoside-specific PTS transporter subunit IIABC n=1 Tax=Alkalicoccus chagannorensis TaxID=427072 RepID=UPI00041118D3|nr:beta-glucoside-specific PTS transporter subunit IIABC [Alkalicoccus chagannorensis]